MGDRWVDHQGVQENHVKKTTVERKGDWIITFTGRRFYPLDPRVEDVNINDVAHALSNQCRFAGHCMQFYSVAQHSVLVSMMCPDKDALWGLLHDASEAYLVDVPSPLKRMPEFKAYRDAEAKVMATICAAFGLDAHEPPSVKLVDKRMLATEARDLTFTKGHGWASQLEPYDLHIQPWTPEHSRIRFLGRLHELTMKKAHG